MSLSASAFVTLAETKTFVGEATSTNDSTIELMIDGRTSDFEQMTRRKIKQQTLTDYRVDGNGKRSLLLPWVPTQSVSKIDMRFDDDTVYKTLTDSTKWILKSTAQGLLELTEDSFIKGSRNILVTMVVGYAASDIDYIKLRGLILMQLKFDYKQWNQQLIGITSRTLNDGSVAYVPAGQFIKEVREALEKMRDETAA